AKLQDFFKEFLTVKTAMFLRKTTPLKKTAIAAAFAATMKNATGNALYREIGRSISAAAYKAKMSALVFRDELEPPFLRGTAVRDVTHGFVAILELRELVAIFKKHASGIERNLAESTKPLRHGELSRLFARAGVAYERMGMRMMHVSKYTIHARSFEAP